MNYTIYEFWFHFTSGYIPKYLSLKDTVSARSGNAQR